MDQVEVKNHYVVVTGGRDFTSLAAVSAVLNPLFEAHGERLRIVNGGARGADALSTRWARARGVPYRVYAADWSAGRGAGYARNEKMAALAAAWRTYGHTVEVVAFPGGKGTRHMIGVSRSRRLPVTVVGDWLRRSAA